jgi:hypothetical protein
MDPVLLAHRHTTNNRSELEASKLCGCCSCLEIFSTESIFAWTGLDMSSLADPDTAVPETGLCPRCGSEALIGDKSGFPLNADFLARMNRAWFHRTVIRKPSPSK